MVNVKPSEDFEKILSKLDKSVRIKINKLIDRIILNPKIVVENVENTVPR